MSSYKYKFSFVMPVYNVEDYLAESIESILAQTMDFVQNCELILINDGSPDNSEEVCLRYQRQFPNNIKYIKQKNIGPGAARNRGIAEASGKYISLVDSDDKISPNTLAEVYNFFEQHYDAIDLVAIKQQFFEARTGDHPLNYKFTSDRIIDLEKDFDQVQMSATSAFFKKEALQKHKFKESVGRYAEDSHLIGRILLDKQKFAIVSRPTYFYRKRMDQASSLDATKTDSFWYLETPKRAWYDLLGCARTQGSIPKFIQYMVMYDLQWRFKQMTQTALSTADESDYKKLIYGLLPDIEDSVIMRQRNISIQYKLFALSKKYNEDIIAHAQKQGDNYFYRDIKIYEPRKVKAAVHIEFIEAAGSKLRIEGFFDGVLFGDAKLRFRSSDKMYDAKLVERPDRRETFLGDEIGGSTGFLVEVPAFAGRTIAPFVAGEAGSLPLATHRFSRLSQSTPLGYCIVGTYLVRKLSTQLSVRRLSHSRRLYYELVFWAALLARLKLGTTRQAYLNWRQLRNSGVRAVPRDYKWLAIPVKAAGRSAYVIAFRAAYFIAKPFFRQPVWLLSDRIVAAGDSGEILFDYLNSRPDVPAKAYFVIDKSSNEYAALKARGSVLNYHTLRYKLMFLLADKIISSEATDHVINAFGGRMDDLVDLYNFDFVFLQHGIIRDDISGWLNRYDKNIKLFLTSALAEQQSILAGAYGYGPDVVKLTGLPRYDNMLSRPKNKLIIAPTWRLRLAGNVNPRNGERLYNPNFKQSNYYHFFQKLMDDERLQRALQAHKMTAEFYLHHSLQAQLKDFKGNRFFNILEPPLDYPRARCEGELLLTDYSSVAFEFAYLHKPVIYAQFDKDTYYKTSASREGYFSFGDDGFGPVTHNYEDTIRQIIKIIESGCTMEAVYKKRVERFFAYHDAGNCQRAYQEILALKQQ